MIEQISQAAMNWLPRNLAVSRAREPKTEKWAIERMVDSLIPGMFIVMPNSRAAAKSMVKPMIAVIPPMIRLFEMPIFDAIIFFDSVSR